MPLESYKDKLSNKLYFVNQILNKLKVISEKPKVNQVVPYTYPKLFNRIFGRLLSFNKRINSKSTGIKRSVGN